MTAASPATWRPTARGQDRGSPPAPQAVRPFQFPDAAEARLSNGLPVHVISRSGFPLATVVLAIRGGEACAPAGKGGLPSLCGDALAGGTASMPASELALAFESIGASFATSTSWDAASATVSCLAEHLPRAMELHAHAVQSPACPKPEFDRFKSRRLAAVRQRAMNPAALAADVHARLVFGEGSLYGRPVGGTADSLADLRPADALEFSQARHGPDQAALIVAGDVDVQEVVALAERCWSDWGLGSSAAMADEDAGHGSEPVAPTAGPSSPPAARRIDVVHRPGAVQAEIRAGHVGVSRAAPDFIPLQIFNLILGGAFSSRLNLNLRERRGLTYGVRSAFAARRKPGPFYVSTAVDAASTGLALAEIVREIEDLARDGPTAEEVSAAVSYSAGVFPTRFQGLGAVAAAVARLFVYDLPSDYYRAYRDRVRSVGQEDAAAAGRAHLRPSDLRTVVVGDADVVVPLLEAEAIGEVVAHEEETGPSPSG